MRKILAAHNVETAYNPLSFKDKLLNVFSKCQSKKANELYRLGVSLFDIRFRVYNKKVYCTHGLCNYKVSPEEIISSIIDEIHRTSGRKRAIFIRLLNEDSFLTSDIKEFEEYCKMIIEKFSHLADIKWLVMPSKKAVKPIIADFNYEDFIECFWYYGRKPWFPKWYAKKYNKVNLIKYREAKKSIWWFDFL